MHCKEYDHIKRDYPKHANMKKSNNLKIKLVKEQEEYIGDVLIVSKAVDTFSHNEWVLDSSCLVHICSKKELFDNFKRKNMCCFYVTGPLVMLQVLGW